MPLVLRTLRKAKWHRNPEVPWLGEGELQADALVDLKTENNRLSVWHVEDDESNLDAVLAALAAGRDSFSNLDYALFDDKAVVEIGATMEQTRGGTPDEVANIEWHRDLVELTAGTMMRLAKVIQSQARLGRMPWKRAVTLVAGAAKEGRIEPARLKAGMKKKVLERLPGSSGGR